MKNAKLALLILPMNYRCLEGCTHHKHHCALQRFSGVTILRKRHDSKTELSIDLNMADTALGSTAHLFLLAESLSLLAEAVTLHHLSSFLLGNSTTTAGCFPFPDRGSYVSSHTVILEVVSLGPANSGREDCPTLLPRSSKRQVCSVWGLRDPVTASLHDP